MEIKLHKDIIISDQDIELDSSLKTAIFISLFTDKQVSMAESPHEQGGWWANPNLGSRLWLLKREKITEDLIRKIKAYSDEALHWMVESGMCESIKITAVRNGLNSILIDILVKKNNQYENHSFDWKPTAS